jgi:hypothetical protein
MSSAAGGVEPVGFVVSPPACCLQHGFDPDLKYGRYRNLRGSSALRDEAGRLSRKNNMGWRDYLLMTVILSLFGVASVATVLDGSLSHMKGAWVAQAMR